MKAEAAPDVGVELVVGGEVGCRGGGGMEGRVDMVSGGGELVRLSTAMEMAGGVELEVVNGRPPLRESAAVATVAGDVGGDGERRGRWTWWWWGGGLLIGLRAKVAEMRGGGGAGDRGVKVPFFRSCGAG